MKRAKKISCMSGALLILVLAIACLNPIGFDLETLTNLTITGDMYFTDVTAAVIFFNNQSTVITVNSIDISQPYAAVGFFRGIEGRPPPQQRAAIYVAPSDKSYQAKVSFTHNGVTDLITINNILMTHNRQIREYNMFVDENDKVVIGEVEDIFIDELGRRVLRVRNINTNQIEVIVPKQDVFVWIEYNVSNEIDDLKLIEIVEGSSPAVIPPGLRNRMATIIAVNRTQGINPTAQFTLNTVTHSIGAIRPMDSKSIALSQGTWDARFLFNSGGDFTRFINVHVVPSNDPQSIREHYIYFYRTNLDTFDVTTSWPPSDLHPNDRIPGVTIINLTEFMVINVRFVNRDDPNNELIINDDEFRPRGYINPENQGTINFQFVQSGEPGFRRNSTYDINITLESYVETITYNVRRQLTDHTVITIRMPAAPGVEIIREKIGGCSNCGNCNGCHTPCDNHNCLICRHGPCQCPICNPGPPPPPFWFVPETVVRIYGIGIIHSPTALIFVEDYFDDTTVSAPKVSGGNYIRSPFNGSGDHLAHTGRTDIPVSANAADFNGSSITTTNRFRDNVLRAYPATARVHIFTIDGSYFGPFAPNAVPDLSPLGAAPAIPNRGELRESGGPLGSKTFIDIRLPRPTGTNNGWWLYHRTGAGTNWIISYTQPAMDAPSAPRHFRYWVGTSLMDPASANYSVVRVDNQPYRLLAPRTQPSVLNTGQPVLPIGIFQLNDTVSILRPQFGLATTTPSGFLVHTAFMSGFAHNE